MRLAAVASSLLLAVGISNSVVAQPSFYEGKTIHLIVGTETGGGYDIYARTVARHIGRHIPGKPHVIVQNMPGAGSAKAADFLFSLAPKDGLTIGLIFPGMVIEPLMQPGKFRFDPTKYEYLGTADSGARLCITHRSSKIKTFDDALKMPSLFGGTAPGSSTTDYAQLLINLAGTKMKIVNGYVSTVDTVLAAERGEIDGLCGYDSSSFRAQKPDWFNTPEAQMIVHASIEPFPELTKMGVPHIWQYVSGENRRIAEVILAQQEFHRPFITPPGVSKERLAVLRTAFMATMNDPQFLEDAKLMKLTIAAKDGETVAGLVQKMYGSSPELLDKVRRALKPM
jgi:tripartite-type tricarboxylate transporter receptor subunit TctC